MALWQGTIGATTVVVVRGDITKVDTEVITNAANEDLVLGGGVAGAIRSACGVDVQRECDQYTAAHGPVATGQVVVTGAGRLAYKAVLHAVGPVFDRKRQDNEERLGDTVKNVLVCADGHKYGSVAIPAISSGIFGFPKPLCAFVFFRVVEKYLKTHAETSVKRVVLVNNDEYTVSGS